jgi:enoyl-CoA hydratase
MHDIVTYKLESGVATVFMDDGKVNVVSPQLIEQLNRALDQARSDQAAVVLAGRDGTFSAGFDRKVLFAGGQAALDMLIGGFKLAERLYSFPRPVVAACTGHALAMGAFLLLAADYRIGTCSHSRSGREDDSPHGAHGP